LSDGYIVLTSGICVKSLVANSYVACACGVCTQELKNQHAVLKEAVVFASSA
jgi:hypothetical protein